MYKCINELNLSRRRVFIRADYNISLKTGGIRDDRRILASLPTIQYALEQKAKVILASHLGRPKGTRREDLSLLPVAECLSELLKRDVVFPEDCIGDAVKKLAMELRDGEILLLENLRFHPEEEANDTLFAAKLASLAEVYINDAFGTAHRAHASTVGMVSHFTEKGIGLLMKKELKNLGQLLSHPPQPFVAILGGAKVADKIGVVERLLHHVNTILIGGGMAYTFLKAAGFSVGTSLVEENKVHQAEKIMEHAELKGVKICLPVDSVAVPSLKQASDATVLSHKEPWPSWMGVDIGPATIERFAKEIRTAQTVFWNGPLGVFEIPPFHEGTLAIARLIAERKILSVVGGGDSLAAIQASGVEDHFTHLSTGGGASLKFLEGKQLPGLGVLETIIS